MSMLATPAIGLDPATLLLELLRTPSVTGDVDAAAEWLLEMAGRAGFATQRDAAGNVVLTWGTPSAEGGDDVMLLGHLDTVSGDLPVHESRGRLHGRGAVDAKGPLAAAVAAVSRLPADGGRAVTVVAVCDEEGPSLGARHLCSRAAPAALIVLEPSGWDTVTTGYRGCVRFTVSVRLPASHHAVAHAGAADRLLAVLAATRATVPESRERAVDSVQMRVNSLRTEENGLEDRAAAEVEVRIPDGVSVADVMSWIRPVLDGAELSVASACEPATVSRTNPVARALARGIAGAGGRPRYTTKTGTADLNVMLPVWRCDAVVYGPGDCSLDHSPIESIDIGELRRGADVLEAAVRSLR